MENLIYFLIWIRFIPIIPKHSQDGWSLHFKCPRFILLMVAYLVADALYLYYIISQLLSKDHPPILSEWTNVIFKVANLIGAPIFPILLGPGFCAYGSHACHRGMNMPLGMFIYVIGLVVVSSIGMVGIHVKGHTDGLHVKGHTDGWSGLLIYLTPVALLTCFSYVFNNLICFCWMYDFLASCPDGKTRETITADESDAVIEQFENLKAGTEFNYFMFFSYLQLLMVFSLYNTLQGEIHYSYYV